MDRWTWAARAGSGRRDWRGEKGKKLAVASQFTGSGFSSFLCLFPGHISSHLCCRHMDEVINLMDDDQDDDHLPALIGLESESDEDDEGPDHNPRSAEIDAALPFLPLPPSPSTLALARARRPPGGHQEARRLGWRVMALEELGRRRDWEESTHESLVERLRNTLHAIQRSGPDTSRVGAGPRTDTCHCSPLQQLRPPGHAPLLQVSVTECCVMTVASQPHHHSVATWSPQILTLCCCCWCGLIPGLPSCQEPLPPPSRTRPLTLQSKSLFTPSPPRTLWLLRSP